MNVLGAALRACLLMLTSLAASPIWATDAASDRPPFEFVTRHGTFTVPRDYAMIDEWRTIRVQAIPSNYFVVRLTAQYVARTIPGFAADLNQATQDVILAVEALSPRRRAIVEAASASDYCWVAPHDTKPQSVPYERCEYHQIFGDSVAVKFWLNGENRAHLAEMIGLIEEKLEAWRSQ